MLRDLLRSPEDPFTRQQNHSPPTSTAIRKRGRESPRPAARAASSGAAGRRLRAVRRGQRRSFSTLVSAVRCLTASIRTWLERGDDEPTRLVWHEPADEILENVARCCQQ